MRHNSSSSSSSSSVIIIIIITRSLPCGEVPTDAEMKVVSSENTGLTKSLFSKPVVLNIALHAPSTAGDCTFVLSLG